MAVCLLTACKAGYSICMMKPLKTTIAWMSSSHAEQTTNGSPLHTEYRFEKIWKCVCSSITSFFLLLRWNKLFVNSKCDFSASETDFALCFPATLTSVASRKKRLYCCIYEIQSMEGRGQGVTLHNALCVSSQPQNRMLLWHSLWIFRVTLIVRGFAFTQKLWKNCETVMRCKPDCVWDVLVVFPAADNGQVFFFPIL